MSKQRGIQRSVTVPKDLRNERYYLLYKGDPGKSNYDLAVSMGFTGTLAEWLLSIKGEKGDIGTELITFETVSKNLNNYPYVDTYNGEDIDYRTYDLGHGLSIVKTWNYTAGVLTSLVLSGNTPPGILLTKTFIYTGDKLTSVTYS